MSLARAGSQALLTGGILLAAACGGSPSGHPSPAPDPALLTRGYSELVRRGFGEVRAATAAYASLDAAVAAGYAGEVPRCYVDAHHGAMGYHHLNRGYVDAKAEVARPEILLYERRADGGYGLNGVEYIIPYRLWPRDSVPPAIMGETMKQEDELQLWYLHMWIWKQNPAGLFADWNPEVKCPAADG
jgi:hypothetical protein